MSLMSGKAAKANRRKQVETPEERAQLDATMFRDDVSWWTSLVFSADKTDWEAAVGLAIATQVARVLHEGLGQLRRVDPEKATSLSATWDDDIATARHTVKLLDDNKKTVDSVLAEFAAISTRHSDAFGGLGDFAYMESDGRMFATTRLMSYQALADLDEKGTPRERNRSYRFSETMGHRTVLLQRGFGMGDPLIRAVSLPKLPAPSARTTSTKEFAATSYDDTIAEEAKDVAMVIECSVNAALHVFEPTAPAFASSLFRVRFVAATHALSALEQLLARFPSDDSAIRHSLQRVIHSPASTHIKGLRQLRNRSMHYGIPPALNGLQVRRPAYGLVEATTGGAQTFLEVDASTQAVLRDLSDVLRDWRQR
jgi:hypothetical protein